MSGEGQESERSGSAHTALHQQRDFRLVFVPRCRASRVVPPLNFGQKLVIDLDFNISIPHTRRLRKFK